MKYELLKKINPARTGVDCILLPFGLDKKKGLVASAVNKACGGQIQKILQEGDFSGKCGQNLLIPHPAGTDAKRILLLGLGDKKKMSATAQIAVLKKAFSMFRGSRARHLAVDVDGLLTSAGDAKWCLQQLAWLCEYGNYFYRKTKTDKTPTFPINKLSLIGRSLGTKSHRAALATGLAMGRGCNLTRELGNLPPNICTPRYLSSQARLLSKKYPRLSAKVFTESQIKKLGMNAMLSVSAGSAQPPRLIVLEYKGGGSNKPTTALVGKGVTFDTGGISIKPSAQMDEMKFDMCGAATVLGTIMAVAEMKLKVNLVGLVGAVENMPGDQASRPGDIVKSMQGTTVEILNTDAEGRLVLCDVLHYAKRYKPKRIIDIATLTGACVVALGNEASGLFANDEKLAAQLLAAGEYTGDRGWRLPLWEEYQPLLKSNFADVANIGGRWAGSITAACFLQRFVRKEAWAHLDIAGTAWLQGSKKEATGRPVALLTQFLIDTL